MSTVRASALSDFQEDLRWPLLADPFFGDVTVIDYLKGQSDSEIKRALGTMTTRSGKCGACVVVMPLAIADEYSDASAAHPLKCRITFLVLEAPILNMHLTQGTRKTALTICERIRQVMKHRIFGGFSNCLAPADPTFVAVEDPVAPIAWEVHFEALVGVDQNFVKADMPIITYDTVTGTVTLTCPNTPNPTILYTLDGSYPYTSTLDSNSGALTYTAPLPLEGEWTLRAAAYADGWLPSNVAFARSTDIGDQTGEGGGIGGLN